MRTSRETNVLNGHVKDPSSSKRGENGDGNDEEQNSPPPRYDGIREHEVAKLKETEREVSTRLALRTGVNGCSLGLDGVSRRGTEL